MERVTRVCLLSGLFQLFVGPDEVTADDIPRNLLTNCPKLEEMQDLGKYTRVVIAICVGEVQSGSPWEILK